MSQDCKHFNVIGHEHGAWCQECGKQVGGSMLREPVTIPSPLVIAADQLAQAAENVQNAKNAALGFPTNNAQTLVEGLIKAEEELDTKLANYKRVREG
jgi:hypothetical protein